MVTSSVEEAEAQFHIRLAYSVDDVDNDEQWTSSDDASVDNTDDACSNEWNNRRKSDPCLYLERNKIGLKRRRSTGRNK